MKIGFDAKRVFHNTTGLGNYSRDLVSILASKYTENSYYLYNTKPKKVDRLKKYNNVFEILPNSKFWKKLSSIWRQKAIVRQIEENGVHIYHGLSGEIPIGLSKKNIKTVVTIHDLIFVRYPNLYSFFDRKIHFLKFKYATKNADVIIAISKQTKQDIVTYLHIEPSKIKVIYQGCHAIFKEAFTEEEKEALKEKYSLPDKFILNVGTIEERKNALSIVKSIKNIDINLVIVGKKTPYYNTIKEYIEQNKLENKVYFLEGMTLKELATLYQSAQAFVYPSIFEGFGIPIIEALYSKTPVITTKEGVFPEAGGSNSLYVEAHDIDGLKTAIEKVLSDALLRAKMIDKGYEFVKKFNDDAIGDEMMKVYKNLLNE